MGSPGIVTDVDGSLLTEKVYNIIGDVNMNFVATGIEFIMNGSTTINAGNAFYNSLALINCQLHSCSSLWKGIRVQHSNSDLVTFNNTVIKDAEIAIEGGVGSIYIVDTKFINNREGIHLSNNIVIYAMNNISFEGSAALRPDINGGKAASYAGIVIENLTSSLDIVDNHFSNLPYGVKNLNSVVSILISEFNNLTANGYSASFIPCGIYTDGTGLANLTSDFNTFDKMRFAIADNRSSLTAQNNTITNTIRGIHVQNCDDAITISNNREIRCVERGIVLYNNMDKKNDVTSNHIFIDEPKGNNGIGISVWNDKLFDAKISLTGNHIFVDGGSNGIRVMNSEKAFIGGNEVTLNKAIEKQMGINVMNSRNCDVLGNTITGAGTTIAGTNSIRIVGSTNFNASCNNTANTETGFLFEMPNGQTTFNGNRIYDHSFGMALSQANNPSNVSIGAQDHLGTIWKGNYSSWGAIHREPILSNQSLFFVGDDSDEHEGCMKSQPSFFLPSNNVPNWFTPDTKYNLCCLDKVAINSPELSPNEWEEIRETIKYEHYNEPTKWMIKRDIYPKIVVHPEWQEEYPELAKFVNEYQEKSVGQLYAIERQYKALNEAVNSKLEAIKIKIREQRHQETIYLETLRNPKFDGDKKAIETAIAEIQTILSDYLLEWEKVQAEDITQKHKTIEGLIVSNNQIATEGLYDENEKTMNDIIFRTLAIGIDTLDENQTNTIQYIAYQCPMLGGKAVFRARSLFSLQDDSVDFETLDLCANPSGRIVANPLKSISDLSISPNPANQSVIVKLDAKTRQQGQLYIYNSLGNLFLQQMYETPSVEINVSAFPNGMYLFKTDNGKPARVIILK